MAKCKSCGIQINDNVEYCQRCADSISMKKCINCGTPIHVGERFCHNCGFLLARVTCRHCGTQVSASAHFCNNCGHSLASEICKYCGAQVSVDAVICSNCNRALTDPEIFEIEKANETLYYGELHSGGSTDKSDSLPARISRAHTRVKRNGKQKKSSTSRLLTFILIFLLLSLGTALVITNPTKSDHERIIFEQAGHKFGGRIGEEIGGETGGDIGEVVGGFLGGLLGDVAKEMDVSLFKYNNYIFFSTMTFSDRTISIGVLGTIICQ